ncbi:phospholipid-translocating P-type ATPase, flippase [Nitzschia inconspicua]|uniref:Phospholipid-translocating P-type ATPase, flippase n=1 Tax=Nitzschia inconspicua TaxID=303405 RepID=A0A9K3LH59_9STRA|nr:phospholipid-translocating P-type ATPase, flippase [Nitzschia inconspicua]
MHFIALVSGGKDSIYSMMHAIRNGHTLLGCLHMKSPATVEEESYMYQTAASSTVQTLVEDCLQVPLLLYERKGKSIHTGLVYDGSNNSKNDNNGENQVEDEVEDLYRALQQAQQQFPSLQAVSSGAILSTYQRMRIENVCQRLGLTSISYLWRLAPQQELLKQMLDDGIDAVLVKTACPPGLMPRHHLNKTLRYMWDSGLLQRLHQRYQFHVCGEGGEYESLVLDSPLHKKKLVLDEVEIIQNEDDDDGVGELRILSCHAEEKDDNDVPILPILLANEAQQIIQSIPQSNVNALQPPQSTPQQTTTNRSYSGCLPHVHHGKGGLLHVSELMAPSVPHATTTASSSTTITTVSSSSSSSSLSEADLAVQEAQDIFSILQRTLDSCHATPNDVVFVHLYLSEMSHFTNINVHYQSFFGTLLPPSRSCVAIGNNVLPDGRRVLLDCLIQLGSGQYMRSHPNSSADSINNHDNVNDSYCAAAHATSSSKLREVLHVQSISYWAPVCVGPYSQTNTIRSGIHFLAGQIGLIPSNMTLRDTWDGQLDQCWTNIAAVLDALNGVSLQDICGSLIYVSSDVLYNNKNNNNNSDDDDNDNDVLLRIASITASSMKRNGSIVPGKIDDLVVPNMDTDEELYGGYEDEGTWEEMKKNERMDKNENGTIAADELSVGTFSFCPMLVVCVPELPKGALVEVEVVTPTADAVQCLEQRFVHGNVRTTAISRLSSSTTATAVSTAAAVSTWFDTGHDFPIISPHERTEDDDNISTSSTVISVLHPPKNSTVVDVSTTIKTKEYDWIGSTKAFARVIGHGCAALGVAIALGPPIIDDERTFPMLLDTILDSMLTSLEGVLADARSGLTRKELLHIRLFHVPSTEVTGSSMVRLALRRVVQSHFRGVTVPATTVVPVLAIDCIGTTTTATTATTATATKATTTTSMRDSSTLDDPGSWIVGRLAIQALFLDPVHLETEIWIHKDRRYATTR